jgi:hypothetical protein
MMMSLYGKIVWQNILAYTRYENGVCACIKMVSQRNRTHNETLRVLRVLGLWFWFKLCDFALKSDQYLNMASPFGPEEAQEYLKLSQNDSD